MSFSCYLPDISLGTCENGKPLDSDLLRAGRTFRDRSFPESLPLLDGRAAWRDVKSKLGPTWNPGSPISSSGFYPKRDLRNHSSSDRRHSAVLCYSLGGRKIATCEQFWRVAELCSSCRLVDKLQGWNSQAKKSSRPVPNLGPPLLPQSAGAC